MKLTKTKYGDILTTIDHGGETIEVLLTGLYKPHSPWFPDQASSVTRFRVWHVVNDESGPDITGDLSPPTLYALRESYRNFLDEESRRGES